MLSENLSKTLLDHLRQAVLLVDSSGKVVFCNESALLLWRLDSARLRGMGVENLFRDDHLIRERLKQVLQSEKEFQLSGYKLQTPPLKLRVAEIVLTPLRNGAEVTEHALITLLDSTRFNESRMRQQETEVSHSVNRLLATIAHEIRNPLGGLKGVLQLMERDMRVSGMDVGPAGIMFSEIERIERLLRQLALHSHPVPLQSSRFNLHELLDTVILFEENTKPALRFLRRFDPSLPDIGGDRDKLHQVFLNLIRNAAEAIPDNGAVTIRTRYCARWELAGTNLDPRCGYQLVSVEDEGPGVTEEMQSRLFKPLFTTKPKGHGLGLSISYRLVESHGGLLRYRAGKAGGAVFQVFLPETLPGSMPAAIEGK